MIVFWLFAIPLVIVAGMSFAKGQTTIALGSLAGVLFFRVIMEALTVLFQIHDVLVEIRDSSLELGAKNELAEKMQRARDLAKQREKPQVQGESRLDH